MGKLDINEMWRTNREITKPAKYGEQFLNAMSKARYGDLSGLSRDEVGTVLKVASLAAAAGVAVAGAPYAQKVVDNAGDNLDHIYSELKDSAHWGSNIPIQMLPGYMLADMILKDEMKSSAASVQHGKAAPPDASDPGVIGSDGNSGSSIGKAVPPIVAGAAASGCVDDEGIEDIAEPVDKTIVYVYQKGLNKEGNPQNIISNQGLYALVDESRIPGAEIKEAASGGNEKGGEPVLIPLPTPVSRYAIQKDLETGEISIYDAENNLVDQSDIPADWEQLIVKDKYGVPITDPSKFLNINPIGKNKYEILNLAQEMEDPDGEHIWRISHAMENKYEGDTKFNDNIFKIGDGVGDMFGGFARGEDGNVYGVILADEDVFKIYGGDFGTTASGENTATIVKSMCTDTKKGIYMYIYDLPKIPEDGVSVRSHNPISQEMHISREKGGFAQFMFLKEKL